MSDLRKFPRTPHLPWSPGAAADDERVVDVAHFVGKRVIVTEKLDGECCTIHRYGCYARSLDTAPHPSRTKVRALAGEIGHELGPHRLVGENVFAKHSIHYDALPAHFLLFGVWYGYEDPTRDFFLDWKMTLLFCGGAGNIHGVPVLYAGPWDEAQVKACFTGRSLYGGDQEGYVVRLAGPFLFDDFGQSVAKYVRKNHVQTDEHWLSKPVVKNGLAPGVK